MAAHAWKSAEEVFASLDRRQEQHRQHRRTRDEIVEALEALADELHEHDVAEQRCWQCPACEHLRRIRESTA
jgi:hypothetical protein